MKIVNPRSQGRISIKVTGEKECRGEYLVPLFLKWLEENDKILAGK
jgi:hypothetical protein